MKKFFSFITLIIVSLLFSYCGNTIKRDAKKFAIMDCKCNKIVKKALETPTYRKYQDQATKCREELIEFDERIKATYSKEELKEFEIEFAKKIRKIYKRCGYKVHSFNN